MKIYFWVVLLCIMVPVSAGAMPAAARVDTHILRNTYYYVALESVYAGRPLDAKIRNMKGELIAEVNSSFKKAVDIEGTGRLIDGRVINFAGRVEHDTRYFISDARYGYGVGTCKLQPFRTVAVDPSVIALGSVVYIKETDGMRLPGRRIHDGYWRADDIGGAIKHDRIDLFVGNGDRGEILVAAGIHNLKPLTVQVVEPPASDTCARRRH